MRRITESTFFVISSIIVTLLSTTVLEIFSANDGRVNISPPIAVESSFYLPITIENYSSKTIDGVKISVPRQVEECSIHTSYPVEISEKHKEGNLLRKKVTISDIDPKSKLQIMLPLPKENDHQFFSILNAKESKLSVEGFLQIENPIMKAFWSGLQTSLIYAFVFSVALFIFNRKQDNLLRRIDDNKKKLETHKREIETHKREIEIQDLQNVSRLKRAEETSSDLLRVVRRTQVALQARISDYAKELEFWRNTIRKILYSKEDENKTSDMIIRTVTETLHTFSTLRGYDQHSFKSIEVLADLIAYREAKKDESDIG